MLPTALLMLIRGAFEMLTRDMEKIEECSFSPALRPQSPEGRFETPTIWAFLQYISLRCLGSFLLKELIWDN